MDEVISLVEAGLKINNSSLILTQEKIQEFKNVHKLNWFNKTKTLNTPYVPLGDQCSLCFKHFVAPKSTSIFQSLLRAITCTEIRQKYECFFCMDHHCSSCMV